VRVPRANGELGSAEGRRKVRDRVACARPEALELDGQSGSRRHRPVADFRVHPRESETRVGRGEESLVGDVDVVARASFGGFECKDERVEQLSAHELVGLADELDEETRGLEEPERRVGGVKLGRLALVGQTVGHEAVLHLANHRAKHLARDVGLAVDEQESG
jgi:hypothetical protein